MWRAIFPSQIPTKEAKRKGHGARVVYYRNKQIHMDMANQGDSEQDERGSSMEGSA